MEKTFGFIGCGNMGGALIRAASKSIEKKCICVTDKDSDKADLIAKETETVSCSIEDIAEKCRYIYLGVKPQVMEKMLSEIKDILHKRTDRFVLITMAAGITIERLKNMCGNFPVIRIMPNLPASVGEGMILYCSENTTDEEISDFKKSMSKAGLLSEIEEKLIDAGSSVSGCGPAFVCMFAEALADGGVKCGLKRETAIKLALQTLLGTSKMLLESGMHPEVLKDNVCSPGGTTIEGVIALENGSFRADTINAVVSAYNKNKLL